MKILVVGGGSGGHITPAVAVVREILEKRPRTRVEFWTDRKYYRNVAKITTEIGVRWGGEEQGGRYVRVRKILAGKFHRYAGWEFADYFRNFGTTLRDLVWGNIKGFLGFIGGLVQSFFRLLPRSSRPDVVFLKGGFVGLPVGLVSRLFRIPFVIHESDVVPGLANRILMRKAAFVADVNNVGIPVAEEFKRVSSSKKKELKKAFGFDPEKPLVVVTGGSQGSLNINEAVREILPEMLKFASVGLVAGRKHYDAMVDLKKYEEWSDAKLTSNFRMWYFCSVMNELLGAADVVVSRAGATTIAEMAALEKAVVLVPFEKLPGGHQVKNAERLVEMKAAEMVRDDKMVKNPTLLLEAVRKLARSPKKRAEMAKRLGETARPHAARDLAEIVLKVGEGKEVLSDVSEKEGDDKKK